MNQEIVQKRKCICRLCGKEFTSTTNRRYCAICRRVEFRLNIQMSEAIKRSRLHG
jgi:Zn finger protein HypA/HybF involved in hydrogenase expression